MGNFESKIPQEIPKKENQNELEYAKEMEKLAIDLWWKHRKNIVLLQEFIDLSKDEFEKIMSENIIESIRMKRGDDEYDNPITPEEMMNEIASQSFSYINDLFDSELSSDVLMNFLIENSLLE